MVLIFRTSVSKDGNGFKATLRQQISLVFREIGFCTTQASFANSACVTQTFPASSLNFIEILTRR